MRTLCLFGCIVASACVSFAQTGGTITGTVVDPAGGVVANASIEARNGDTNATYPAASSNTGNYTLSDLPAGT